MKLPGAFESAFWTVLLPQASLSEPAVLHAALSLSSIHKKQALAFQPGAMSAGPVGADLFALRQYTRAITDLRLRICNDSRRSADVALITCATFVQLEYLRGCYQAALTHLRHGLTVLEMTLRKRQSHEASQYLANEWIIQVFCTMTVQAKLLGQDVCRPELLLLLAEQLKPADHVSHSVNYARQSLEAILLRIVSQKTHDSVPLGGIYEDCAGSIDADLKLWLHAWQKGLSRDEMPAILSPAQKLDKFARKLLPIYHSLAGVLHLENAMLGALHGDQEISSASSLSDGQDSAQKDSRCCSHRGSANSTPVNNLLTTLFRSIITECKGLFKMALSPTVRATRLHQYDDIVSDASQAIADIGWIPILFCTAIYCNDSTIQSKAIEMLRLIPHKEGIWDSTTAIIIAEKILKIERQRLELLGSISLETSRLQIELPESPSGQLVLRCLDQEARRRDPKAPEEQYIYAMNLNRWLE